MENILYQDNKSTMLLDTNGCNSDSKCSHPLNIRYFYNTDQKAKVSLTLEIVQQSR